MLHLLLEEAVIYLEISAEVLRSTAKFISKCAKLIDQGRTVNFMSCTHIFPTPPFIWKNTVN